MTRLVEQLRKHAAIADKTGRPHCNLLYEAVDEIEKSRRTAEYWKSEHLAGNEEIERLRRAGIGVIDAFEALGETTDNAQLLQARANCENAMLELKRTLTPNEKGNATAIETTETN